MDAEKQWHQVKQNYLKQVDQNLSQAAHPQKIEILKDVQAHLEQSYNDLQPSERTWENFQNIITQMRPPDDYVDLFGRERPTVKEKSKNTSVLIIAILGGILLLCLISFGVLATIFFIAGKTNRNDIIEKKVIIQRDSNFDSQSDHKTDRLIETVVNDSQVVGKWISVDFVRHIDAFEPDSKKWTGDLYLKSLSFYENGKTSGPWQWTKGSLYHPGDNTKAKYEIRYYNDVPYLFMEWMSGDVTIRGQKPSYYVLKKVK